MQELTRDLWDIPLCVLDASALVLILKDGDPELTSRQYTIGTVTEDRPRIWHLSSLSRAEPNLRDYQRYQVVDES